MAYEKFIKGSDGQKDDLKMEKLDRKANKPISGYRGHIPAHAGPNANQNGNMNSLF